MYIINVYVDVKQTSLQNKKMGVRFLFILLVSFF
jgi:hypothetical protein